MLNEERIPYGMGLWETKVLVKIPNNSIESAKRISAKLNSEIDDEDWGTITPIDVLERVLDGSSERTFFESGELRMVEYHDLENDPNKVIEYFVWEYEQYKNESTETKVA